MAQKKLKLLTWLGALISIGIGLLGLSDRYASTSSRIALGVALAGLVAVLAWRSRAEARLQEERDAARLQDLKRHFELVGTPIEVRGSNALVPILVFGALAVGMLVIAWRDPSVPNIVSAVALLVCVGVLVPLFLPSVGRPLATIHRDGIEVPACGKLEWSEIEGMGLRTHSAMTLEQHFLDLYVPRLAARRDRMHPAYRIFHRLPIPATRKRSVQVRLVGTEDSPKTIEQVCRHLWAARTGRNVQWNALMSERDFEDLRRAHEQLEKMEKLSELIETDLPAATKMLEALELENALHKPEMSARTEKFLSKHPELNSPDPRVRDAALKKIFKRETFEERRARIQKDKMKELLVTLVVIAIFVAFFLLSKKSGA